MLSSRRLSSSFRCLVLRRLVNPSFQRVLLCATGRHRGILCMEILLLSHTSWPYHVLLLYRLACNNTSSSVFIFREVVVSSYVTVHEMQHFRIILWIDRATSTFLFWVSRHIILDWSIYARPHTPARFTPSTSVSTLPNMKPRNSFFCSVVFTSRSSGLEMTWSLSEVSELPRR